MTTPTIPENGLDVSEEMVEAAFDGFRSVLPVKYDPAGSHPRDAIRAALEAALARRIPPADNAVAVTTRNERDDIIIAWLRQRGFIALADEAEKTFQPASYVPATPSYAEGRAAGLREAAEMVRDYPRRIVDRGDGSAEVLPPTQGEIARAIEALIGAEL